MKKTTKRALFLSFASMFLCFTMLLGTTYAWFTDSVESGVNQIVAGNLDVELTHTNGKVADATVQGETKLFQLQDNQKWEPGAMVWENFTVKNAGDLALKYQFVLEGEAIGEKDLRNVIKVAVLDRAIDPVNDTRDILKSGTFVGFDELAPKTGEIKKDDASQEQTFGVVLYWAPSANDNDYNMNNSKGAALELEIGVKLYATQLDAESDSFDDQYDADAPLVWTGKTNVDWYTADPAAAEFEISTADELAGLAAIVNGTAADIAQDTFSGQTIKLTSDIDLGNLPWDTIGRNHDDEGADPFSGTFDGQGHTVSNLKIYIEDNKRDSVGFIGCAKNATIKGLTLENVDINADYFVGGIVGKITSGEIYDCHVKGTVSIVSRRNYAGGIVGDGYYNMEKCSVVADGMGTITSSAVAGGLCGRINEGAHYIKDCTVKNLSIQSSQQVAAITGFVHYGNSILGCTVENVELIYTASAGTKPAIGLASGLWFYKDSEPITIKDNTFKNVTINAQNNVSGQADILYGWEWNDNMTGVIADNNTMENVTNNLIYN